MQNDDRHAILDGRLGPLESGEYAITTIRGNRANELIERAQRANRKVRNRTRAEITQVGSPFVAAASVQYLTHREPVRPAYIDLRPETHTAWTPDSHAGVVHYASVILEIGMR